MKSQLGGACCWLCQASTPLLKKNQKTPVFFTLSWRNTLSRQHKFLMQHLEKEENQEFSPFISASVSVLPPLPKWRGGLSLSAAGVVEHILLIAAAFPLIIAPFG